MKTTKRALFSSVMALILCFSMLVGTTFAWFTDSVESGVNQIVAGTLDVELYNAIGIDETKKVSAETKLFDEIKYWEPGVVAYENLTVANLGNLALKYQLSVNFDNATTNVNGETLAKVLKVGFVEGGIQSTTREGALAEVTEWLPLASFAQTGELAEQNETNTYGIVIYWEPSDIDNDFNMNNGKGGALSIDLGIKLVATQVEGEFDSFGDDYDAGAPWLGGVDYSWYDADAAELTISNAEQLAGLAAIVNGTAKAPVTTLAAGGATTIQDDFAGKTITLTSDIDLNNINWTPIGSFDYDRANDGSYANLYPFRGIFDGQGHTVYNLSIDTPNTDGAGLFACAEAATIKNVNVHNVDIVAASHAAAILGRGYKYATTTTVTNCHVTGNVSILIDWAYVGGIVAKATGLNISDCSVLPTGTGVITAANRNAVGGIVGWVETESGSTFTNCKAANLNLTGWTNIGAITGYIQYGCKIDGCSAENIVLTKTREDGIAAVGLASGCWSYNASKPITITNNTFKNITLNGTYVANTGVNILYGGEYSGTTDTNFVLENNVQENIVNNMVEVSKITDGIIDNNGIKQIYNANGLLFLSGTKISGAYELIADIDLGGAEFKAMSAWYTPAAFNGNGHTISNAKVVSGDNDNGTEQASMFYVSTNGSLTVSDLILKDIVVTTKNADFGYAAAVIGYCQGPAVLNNVDVVNATITGSKSSGMLVGHLEASGSLTATNCDVTGTITLSDYEANGHYAGEYIGTIAANAALTDCTAKVTLGGNLHSANIGTIYGRKTAAGSVTVNGAIPVSTTQQLIDAIKNAPVGEITYIAMADGNYDGNIDITVAALGQSGGDVVIKAMEGAKPVITGTVTLGYRANGIGATMYNANVTFEGITFNHVDATLFSIEVGDVKSLNLVNCTIIGSGETGIHAANGNATGPSKISGCTFINAALQGYGNYCTGMVIEKSTFNNSCINIQGGNGVTIQSCIFNSTLADANNNGSFYVIRSNSTPITVTGCTINIDSTVTGVGVPSSKGWGVFVNRGTTNWTVSDVEITRTEAAQLQTALEIAKCTSTGAINMTDVTVNGVLQ